MKDLTLSALYPLTCHFCQILPFLLHLVWKCRHAWSNVSLTFLICAKFHQNSSSHEAGKYETVCACVCLRMSLYVPVCLWTVPHSAVWSGVFSLSFHLGCVTAVTGDSERCLGRVNVFSPLGDTQTHTHACTRVRTHTHWQRETHISSGCCHLAQISTGSASLCCFWIRCFWILHLIHVLHVAYTFLFYPASVVKTIWLRIKAYTRWWKQLYTLPYAVAFISVIHITY